MSEVIVMTPEQLENAILGALEKFQATRQATKQELPGNMSLMQAVQFLTDNGYPTAKSQIYKFTAAGLIPHRRYGSRLVFNRAELLRWAEGRTKQKKENTISNEAVLSVSRSARKHQSR